MRIFEFMQCVVGYGMIWNDVAWYAGWGLTSAFARPSSLSSQGDWVEELSSPQHPEWILEAQPELAIAGHRSYISSQGCQIAVVRRYEFWRCSKTRQGPQPGSSFLQMSWIIWSEISEKVLCFCRAFLGLRCLQLKLSTLETLCLHLCLLSKRLGAVVLWCCEYRDFVSKWYLICCGRCSESDSALSIFE